MDSLTCQSVEDGQIFGTAEDVTARVAIVFGVVVPFNGLVSGCLIDVVAQSVL
jgi:hypothetical protein